MKKSLLAILFTSTLITSSYAFTPNLIDIYHASLRNDPTFKQALANRDIAQQNLPLQEAALLPQISLAGSLQYERNTSSGSGVVSTPNSSSNTSIGGAPSNKTLGFTVSLTQTIFNYTNWLDVASARSSVKAAYATYTAAVQTLIQTTIQDYFAVILAESTVEYRAAEKRAFYRQYLQAKESYEVGVKTITDMYNAKASYDTSVADYVAAVNDLQDAKENLRAITGTYYKHIAGLRTLPLAKPNPANIDAWTKTAITHNWDLQAAHYTMLSDHQAIKAAFGGHLPSLALDSSYSNVYSNNNGGTVGNSRVKSLSAELALTVPIYSGGEVTAQVRQAIAQYNLAAGQLEETYRTTVNDTRQAYLGAISGISKIKADKQAIISNRSSLEGMEEGYKVGTQTMTDVLIAQKDYYDAQLQYAQDINSYILSLVNLKQAAGTLNINDVVKLNSYLQHTSPTTQPKPILKSTKSVKQYSHHTDKKTLKKAKPEHAAVTKQQSHSKTTALKTTKKKTKTT